jgi:uroporphyrinogen-III synthase
MADSLNVKTYALFANPINAKFVADLEKTGAKVFEFPPLRVEKIVLEPLAIENLKNLAVFDWLILPDVLAAEFFLENLEASGIDLFEIDFLRTCAVGESVADRLRFVQVHADVIPATVETEKAFSVIADYVGDGSLENLKFLFPKRFSPNNPLKERLTTNGAEVVELPVYKTEIINKLEITRMKTLLEAGAIDEFIFTAPTDFIWLEDYFNGVNLTDVFAEIQVSAADGVTFQSARENKIERVGLFRPVKIGKVDG